MRDITSVLPSSHSQPNSPISTVGDHLRISVCCNQGGRKYMEDRINIHCELTDDGRVDYVYIGIYDGHGGGDASNFANEQLLQNIVKQPGFNSLQDSEVLEAIRTGFFETHHAMRKVVESWPRTASGYTSTAGTTASVAFIRRGKLYIGHVGDSGIVMGSKKPDDELIGSYLTTDHKPDSPAEKKRIEDVGGEVMNKSGVMRVVWVRPLRGHHGPVRRSTPKEKIPFLAVARALGDLWSYNSDTDTYVVSPDPDVSVVQLDTTHRCLVFGSDGLWNVIRPQHAVEIINSHEWKEEELNCVSNKRDGYETNHARWLVRHALMRWGTLRADNIGVVTVMFDRPNTIDSKLAKRADLHETSLDNIFISAPTSVVKVSPDRINIVPTKPVELIFYGVSEASFERQSIINGNGSRNGQNMIDSYKIPGYTRHEKGPVFSSLLSSQQTAVVNGLSASYRQYSLTSFGFGSSQAGRSNGKENGTMEASQISPSISSVNRQVNTGRAVAVDNLEEEASELEDELTPLDSATTFKQRKTAMSEPKEGSPAKVAEKDGRINGVGESLFKFGQSPCKQHGTVQCCFCSLVRAPLNQWSETTTTSTTRRNKTPENGTNAQPFEPAAITPIMRRHTTISSPNSTNSDSYKCRKITRHRRSCPPTTPHTYYTRQSCRTTRAGTKLSPHKVHPHKHPHLTPTMDRHKQSRINSMHTNRHRSVPAKMSSCVSSSSIRARRQSSLVRRQHKEDEVTPRKRTPSEVVVRKSVVYREKMWLRSANGMESFANGSFGIEKESNTQGIDGETSKEEDDGPMEMLLEDGSLAPVTDDNVENLGAQFLESLNLETPLIMKNQSTSQGAFYEEELVETSNVLQLRSPGSSKRTSAKIASLNRKKLAIEDRRRASVFVSLKRKLYFDDHALIDQKMSKNAMAISKRIKGLGIAFLKRSN